MAKGGRWNDPVQPGAFALVCILLGVALHVLALRWSDWRLPAVPDAHQLQATTFEWMPSAQSWSGLFDSAPLFVPTALNHSATLSGIASLTEELELFNPYGPILQGKQVLDEQQSALGAALIMAGDTLDESAVLQLFAPSWRPWVAGPWSTEQIPTRIAAMFVVQPVRNDLSFTLRRPASEALLESLPAALWSPAEWLLQVEPTGIVGQALQLSGSGDPSLDAAIRSELQSQAHTWNLPAGYFRVQFLPN